MGFLLCEEELHLQCWVYVGSLSTKVTPSCLEVSNPVFKIILHPSGAFLDIGPLPKQYLLIPSTTPEIWNILYIPPGISNESSDILNAKQQRYVYY